MSGMIVPASPLTQSRLLFQILGFNLNSAAADQTLVPLFGFARYRMQEVIVTNASTTLAALTGTLAVRTATGGGGTAIVVAQNLQALLTTANMIVCTASNSDFRTEVPLYARISTALGATGTADIYVMGTAFS